MGKIETVAILGVVTVGGYFLWVNRASIQGWLNGLGGAGAAAGEAARTGGDVINVLTGQPVTSVLYKEVQASGYSAGQDIGTALRDYFGQNPGTSGTTIEGGNLWRVDTDAFGRTTRTLIGPANKTTPGFGNPQRSQAELDKMAAASAAQTAQQQTNLLTGALSILAPGPGILINEINKMFFNKDAAAVTTSQKQDIVLKPVVTILQEQGRPLPANYSSSTSNNTAGSAALTGLKANVTNTASTFNPSLGAYAWAQPGSPKYAEGQRLGIIK